MSDEESSADGEPALAVVSGEQAPELTDDGKRVAEWFESRGVAVDAVRWDRPVDWRTYDLAFVRSCYEYPTDPDRFRGLLDAMERADVTVCNLPSVLRWNMHKSYVTDLAAEGVPVPETAAVERGAETMLASELKRLGLEEVIVKPAVGTGSEGVFRVRTADAGEFEDRFADLLADGDVLVQSYCPDIAAGERSIAFFGGKYSHAWNSPTTSRGSRATTTATSHRRQSSKRPRRPAAPPARSSTAGAPFRTRARRLRPVRGRRHRRPRTGANRADSRPRGSGRC